MICVCPKCGNEFENNTGRRFCSKKCANSHVQTEEQNLKRKEKARIRIAKKISDGTIKKEIRKCKICQKEFIVKSRNKNQKYCSHECASQDAVKFKNCGGYREGSGRGKSGYYKGIFCSSTYELVYVIYRLDHNLPVKRFEGVLQNEKLKYIPDFIEDNTIVEIKGYYQYLVDEKCKLARSKGYDIKVLYKNIITFFYLLVNYIENNIIFFLAHYLM